jgi:hypothetical protein
VANSVTSEEVRGYILRFIAGDGLEPWEWDDFTSAPIKDKFLDAVRLLCLHVSEAYPPPHGTEYYCGEAGLELMREIAERLP